MSMLIIFRYDAVKLPLMFLGFVVDLNPKLRKLRTLK